MFYRLVLEAPEGGHVEYWRYDPATSTLLNEKGEPALHPLFPAEGPTTFKAAKQVSPDRPGRKRGLKTLKIQMGFSCNYACAYCNQATFSSFLGGVTEDARRFLETLDQWFHPTENDDVRIEFWGGEPFVYWAKFRLLGEALREKFPRAHLNVITNGSLLDDEKVDWLIRLGFGVSISHDGPAQKMRHPEDILDDPEKCRLIRRLQSDGQLGFGHVLTRWNMSLADCRRHIEERLGLPPQTITSYTEEILLPYDDDAMACVPLDETERTGAIHCLFTEATTRHTLPGCTSIRRKVEDFYASLAKRRPVQALGQKCGMDREDSIAVNLMGEVTTCHNTAADGRHRIGTVTDLDGVRLDTAHHHQTREECRHCPVVQLCKGSCMFLEGPHWQVACDVSFTYNRAMLAVALYFLAGKILTRIEIEEDDGRFIRRPGIKAATVVTVGGLHENAA